MRRTAAENPQRREGKQPVSTADLAIAGLVVINVVTIADRHYLAKQIADRVRVVGPPKQAPARNGSAEKPVSILERAS